MRDFLDLWGTDDELDVSDVVDDDESDEDGSDDGLPWVFDFRDWCF